MRRNEHRDGPRRGGGAWRVVLIASLLTSAAALLVRQPEAHAVLNDLPGVGAGVTILAGTLFWRPAARAPWLLFGAGILAFGLGDVVYNVLQLTGGIPLFSAGDVLYLTGGGLLAAALVAFDLTTPESASARGARMLYVDSAAVFLGGFTILWFFVIDPQMDRPNTTALTHILGTTFPTLDVLLLALAARLALTPAFKLTAYRLLVVGIALGFSGDILWRGFPEVAGGAWVSANYYICYSLLGAAALHPSMRRLGDAAAPSLGSGVSVGRIALLGSASLAVPFVLVAQQMGITSPSAWDWRDLAVATVALVVIPALVIYRLVDLVAYSRILTRSAKSSAARLATILDATPLPVRVLAPDGEVLLMNETAAAWNARGLFSSTGRDDAGEGVRRRGLAGERIDGAEVPLRTAEGEERRVQIWTAPVRDADTFEAVVSVFADVTEQHEREERAHHLAAHDPLTGLLNRRGFESSLESAVEHPKSDRQTVVAILDVDNFKFVNDSAGHPAGDALLLGLAQEFAAVIRSDDVLARLSGDEFAVILSSPDAAQASAVVHRLLKAAHDYRLVTRLASLSVTASIGVCEVKAGTNPKDLLVRADAALYEAKEQGRNKIVVWKAESDSTVRRAAMVEWSPRIKEALAEDRLVIYLQPIVELSTRLTVGYEALARLLDRDGSVALPGTFIPPASRLGLMPAIDAAVFDNVARLLEDDESLQISMNLDAASFEDDGLLDHIEAVLVGSPRLASRLGIEITEHTTLGDTVRAQHRLTRLRELGCIVAIDDFGTGFASFAHLRDLPADIVKISHSFVASVTDDPTAAALVQAIISIAHVLGKEVVAEGIETAEVAASLEACNVRYAQGYFFGRPEPVTTAMGTRRELSRAA